MNTYIVAASALIGPRRGPEFNTYEILHFLKKKGARVIITNAGQPLAEGDVAKLVDFDADSLVYGSAEQVLGMLRNKLAEFGEYKEHALFVISMYKEIEISDAAGIAYTRACPNAWDRIIKRYANLVFHCRSGGVIHSNYDLEGVLKSAMALHGTLKDVIFYDYDEYMPAIFRSLEGGEYKEHHLYAGAQDGKFIRHVWPYERRIIRRILEAR